MTNDNLCRHCRLRPRKGTRPFCCCCYRRGYAKLHKAEIRIPRRPERLRDTGLRILDATGTLVLPTGMRIPAPAGFSERYFFDCVHGSRGEILRVLEEEK